MKIIGIVGRAYYNQDHQKIMQVNEAIRMVFSSYEDVSVVSILPTNCKAYVDLKMGEDVVLEKDRKKIDFVLEMCDGFVIPGGTYWYHFDEYVMEYAIKNNKPMLAICAGFQALCSMYAFDRIRFDMTSRFSNNQHYGASTKYIHRNVVLEGTLLKKIIGESSIWVNSVHHDYVDFEFKELTISAISEDGVLEAVELPNSCFVLGVQWHPEYLMDDVSKKIFDGFVYSIKKFS